MAARLVIDSEGIDHQSEIGLPGQVFEVLLVRPQANRVRCKDQHDGDCSGNMHARHEPACFGPCRLCRASPVVHQRRRCESEGNHRRMLRAATPPGGATRADNRHCALLRTAERPFGHHWLHVCIRGCPTCQGVKASGGRPPMRALMLTPDEGHLDRRIAQEAGTLARHGWEVEIHAAVDPDLDYDADLPPGVRLLRNPSLPARQPSPPRRSLQRAKRMLAEAFPPAGRVVETLQYRRRDIAGEITNANLSHLLSLGPFELIVAHDVPVQPLAAHLKAEWASPLISDLHEVFPEQDEHFTTATARRYWRGLEAAGVAASDGILCANSAIADYVRDTHAPAAPIRVVQNSVPYLRPQESGPTLADHYPIPDGAHVMLFAGSLRPHTGLEVLIEGFASANLDAWVLAILGEGALRDELDALVRRQRLEGRVFLGRHIRQRDLIGVAASAHVGLLPYQAVGFNHLIATPNKLFEYIQARLPIATSRLPMVERIVNVHGNGAFVDFSTAGTTAAGLTAFVRDVAPGITPVALEYAATQFSWENEEPALLRLVDDSMKPQQ